MFKFKVGDRVVINEEGFRRYAGVGENPRGVTGTIHEIGTHYRVRWDNGERNSYQEGTISLAKPKMLENE